MKIELLYGVTYKITLGKTELAPKTHELRRILKRASERLEDERGISLPETLSAQRYAAPDGSVVIFAREEEAPPRGERYFACEVYSASSLGGLCRELCREGIHLCCEIKVYVGNGGFRLIFFDPPERTARLCREFGDYCEITDLFAAFTAEYLSETASGKEIERLAEIL